jgi:hypothetical protein
MWQALDTYRDLITNTADVISFTLITPPLVLILAPELSRITSLLFVTFVWVSLFVLIPLMIIITGITYIPTFPPAAMPLMEWLLVAECIIVGLVIFAFRHSLQYWFTQWVSSKWITIGIIIFMLTRLFSCALAINDVFTAPHLS